MRTTEGSSSRGGRSASRTRPPSMKAISGVSTTKFIASSPAATAPSTATSVALPFIGTAAMWLKAMPPRRLGTADDARLTGSTKYRAGRPE